MADQAQHSWRWFGRHWRNRTLAGLTAAVAIALPGLGSGGASAPGSQHGLSASIAINGRAAGPSFQGVGAISGGGGNSRLLIDYPAAQRQQILDYLFKPHYGAALQLLKIEIGGDANSSDGSEPTVEPFPGHLDCGAGYELWLARQALKLDPSIKIYGLQWAAPAFTRGANNDLWTSADIGYLVNWLACAQKQGVPVSYIGGWNEHYPAGSPAVESWYEDLRQALDAHGFSKVQIVAADAAWKRYPSTWAVASDMVANPSFSAAVSVIGVHDICGTLSDGYRCQGSPAARELAGSGHKILLQSELGETPAKVAHPLRDGPGGLARSLINSYIEAGTTGTIMWPALDAMASYLPYENRGLLLAGQPWTGNFQVTPLLWVTAQTTQATSPGWRFVRKAAGFLPERSGSYVTYESPDRSAWSTVLQTSTANKPLLLRFHVTGGLPAREVQVWRSDLNDGQYFAHLQPIEARHGTFSFRVIPGRLYTFTTLRDLSKAGGQSLRVPRSGPMPLPYSVSTDRAGMPALVSPMEGAFTAVRGRIVQTAIGRPVPWLPTGGSYPYAVLGSRRWKNYTVSADVSLPRAPNGSSPPGALLIARFDGYGLQHHAFRFSGYEFTVSSAGTWQLVENGPTPIVLQQGLIPASSRFKMSLTVVGDQLTAAVDGLPLAAVTTTKYKSGLAGLGSTLYDAVHFEHFSVTKPAQALA